MSRWFRVHDDMVDDPKVQRLPADLFKALVNLWCLTSQNEGALPAPADVAFKLRMTSTKAAETITRLVRAGLIDESETGFAPHNWNSRQFKSDTSNERVAAFRKRQRNGDCNVTETSNVTPPETEQIHRTDSETEQKRERPRAIALWPFDDFWRQYPHKVGKQAAEKAFRKAEKSGSTSIDNLMLALMRYAAKTDDRAWCNPATWLNEGRWDDQPAPQLFNGNGTQYGQNGIGKPNHNGITGTAAGDRCRELAELARAREAEAGIYRPDDIS